MKRRYWLFSGDDYYPSGGMKDFKGDFSSITEAKEAFKEGDWAQVIDATTKEVIARFGQLHVIDDEKQWLHRPCWTSEAQIVYAEMQAKQRAKDEKKRKCEKEGHLWGGWTYYSRPSIGPYAHRRCSRCGHYEQSKTGEWG